MTVVASPRLPGIRIDIAPPPPAEALPRMDIAVFVGFASTGPAHRPVAVESVAQFAAVFGPDAPLAWDPVGGERLYANLGAAVRGFFGNGGRRCWVIRVARTPAFETLLNGGTPPADVAVANRFALPGVLTLSSGGTPLAPAMLQARSLGSWSDPLRVQAALAVSSFELSNCVALSSPPPRLAFGTRLGLQRGDLIEFGDRSDDAFGGAPIYATIDSVAAQADGASGVSRVEATICACFEASGAVGSPPDTVSGLAEVAGVLPGPVAARLDLDPTQAKVARLLFEAPVPPGLCEGYWVRWNAGDQTVWLRIDFLKTAPAGSQSGMVNAEAKGVAWREMPLKLPLDLPARASALTLDLRVAAAGDSGFRASGVGLTPAHRFGWWRHVGDDVVYAAQAAAPLPPAASEPGIGFPLAALDSETGGKEPRAWIPLGVSSLYGATLGPLPQTASALERDGLSRFDADLFLDPELAGLRANDVANQADVIRYLSNPPRDLFGVHAALSIGAGGLFNEASLLSLPDAVHPGWRRRNYPEPPLAHPISPSPPPQWFTHRGPCAAAPLGATAQGPDFSHFLDCGERALAAPSMINGPTQPVPRGSFRLSWTESEAGADYQLQEAQRSDFQDTPTTPLYQGSAQHYDVVATRAGVFYYRVRAISGDERSAFSAAATVVVRDDEWVTAPPEAFGEAGEAELLRLHRAVLRLAAATGELFTVLGLPRHFSAAEAATYASRLRAGPGSSVGIDLSGFDFSERRVLSYGALYHPWVAAAALPPPGSSLPGDVALFRDGQAAGASPARSPLQVAPPDGVVAGVFAARASLRGAWIAPANEPFKGVVALTPPIGVEELLTLQEARVNVLRADARGFLTLAADTLSDSEELEWRPINVRRLLILLRRLALQQGANYVFEPNGDVLRRAVERGFTLLLGGLFRRGAFAGATASESFKVLTDDTINTDVDRDAGRFFVELRVAPALPLQFMTLRLVRSGDSLTVVEAI